MKFNQKEKDLIKKIGQKESMSLSEILESGLKQHPALDGRNFLLVYLKQNKRYEIGLTPKAEEPITDEFKVTSLFAIDLNEIVNLLEYLNRNNYVDIVQTGGNIISRPILNIGSIDPFPEDYEFTVISNQELADRLAKLNCSVISKRQNLNTLISNDFLTADEIKYKETLDIASTSAKNSNKLVGLNLLALLLSGLAIWYSFQTNRTSTNNAQKSIDILTGINTGTSSLNDNLKDVNSQFENIPVTIDNFNKNIGELNSTLAIQQKELLENSTNIKRGVTGLNEGINQFEASIEKYNDKLSTTIQQTEKQLELWRKQQEIINKEFSRKPKLRSHFSNCKKTNNQLEISSFCMHNSGDLSADVQSVIIEISPKDFIKCTAKNVEVVRGKSKIKLLISKHSFEDFQVHPEIGKVTTINLFVRDNGGEAKISIIYNSKYYDNEREHILKLKC